MNDQSDKTCLYTYKRLLEKTELEWSKETITDYSTQVQSRLNIENKFPIMLKKSGKKLFEISLN